MRHPWLVAMAVIAVFYAMIALLMLGMQAWGVGS